MTKDKRGLIIAGGLAVAAIIAAALSKKAAVPLEPVPSEKMANVYGRVIDKVTGQPVSSANVILAYSPESLNIPTDNNGYYEFLDVNLIIEGWSMTVMAQGYQTVVKSGFTLELGNNEINISLTPVVIPPSGIPEPSSLLIDYQIALETAYNITESQDPDRWVMIPGYGLQYASSAVGQLKQLMIQEAVSIGMISSSADAYFDRAIMYASNGDTLAPYWWECPYNDGLRFRSPSELQAHIDIAHWEISHTQGQIINLSYDTVTEEDTTMVTNFVVIWQNYSPFTIQGHATLGLHLQNGTRQTLSASINQDASVMPGQSVVVYFPWNDEAQHIYNLEASLYALPSQKLLDTKALR